MTVFCETSSRAACHHFHHLIVAARIVTADAEAALGQRRLRAVHVSCIAE
jgi:hypothetical protein